MTLEGTTAFCLLSVGLSTVDEMFESVVSC